MAMPVLSSARRALRQLLPDLGVALGVFLLLNAGGELFVGGFDTTAAWLSRPAGWLAWIGEAGLGALLIAHAWRPLRGLWRPLAIAALLLVAGWAMVDAITYYMLLEAGHISTTALPFPASFLVIAAALALALEVIAPAPRGPWSTARQLRCLATCAVVALLLPLVLIFTFGPTRYARNADCIVVFGAKVYSDGRPSEALADRVDEGVRLYKQGLAPVMVMSGALDSAHGGSEPASMRDRAIAAGVPASAIVLDEEGVNSAATVDNTRAWARPRGATRVLAVSHYYHLPRVKLLFERAGLRTYTVPATMRRRLRREPYYLAREVIAYHHALLVP